MWSTKSSANPDPTEYPKHLNASGMIGHDRIDFTYGGKNFTVPDACFRPGMVLNWTTDALGSMPSCYVCKLGHYCPTIGGNLSTQLPCPRNYYCAGRGWAEPEKCGHTYDFTRAWAREQCRSTATLRKGLGNATPPTYIEGSLRVFCLVFGTFLLNMLIKVYKVLYIKYFSGKTIARALARTKLKMKGNMGLAMKLQTLTSLSKGGMSAKILFAVFEDIVAKNPDVVKKINGIYQWVITDTKNGTEEYVIDVKNAPGSVYSGKVKSGSKAGVTMTVGEQNFIGLMTGGANAQSLFMGGKLKLKGNMGLAMKLGQLQSLAPSSKL
jgi:hypothetical protein